MRRVILISSILTLTLVCLTNTASAGLQKLYDDYVPAKVKSYNEAFGNGVIQVGTAIVNATSNGNHFLTTTVGSAVEDYLGIGVEDVTGTLGAITNPVITLVDTYIPHGGANFTGDINVEAAFDDPTTGCNFTVGCKAWWNIGSWTTTPNTPVSLLLDFQAAPGTSLEDIVDAVDQMNFGSGILDIDYIFTAELECSSINATSKIPTLSEWGLIILLLLLVSAAIIVIRRRRATTV